MVLWRRIVKRPQSNWSRLASSCPFSRWEGEVWHRGKAHGLALFSVAFSKPGANKMNFKAEGTSESAAQSVCDESLLSGDCWFRYRHASETAPRLGSAPEAQESLGFQSVGWVRARWKTNRELFRMWSYQNSVDFFFADAFILESLNN